MGRHHGKKKCDKSDTSSSSSVERFSENKVRVKNIHYKRHTVIKRHTTGWKKDHESCSKSQ